MHIITYKVLIVGDNFFCASFINAKTDKSTACYLFNDEEHNMEVIPTLIQLATLIGYGNSTFDDIIMRYIYSNKYVKASELYGLKKAINDNHFDVDGYREGYVTSFDLLNAPISFDTRSIHSQEMKVYSSDVASLLYFCKKDAEQSKYDLEALKKYYNDGFISSSKKQKTTVSDNLVKQLIGL